MQYLLNLNIIVQPRVIGLHSEHQNFVPVKFSLIYSEIFSDFSTGLLKRFFCQHIKGKRNFKLKSEYIVRNVSI